MLAQHRTLLNQFALPIFCRPRVLRQLLRLTESHPQENIAALHTTRDPAYFGDLLYSCNMRSCQPHARKPPCPNSDSLDIQRQCLPVVLRRQEEPRERDEAIRCEGTVHPKPPRLRRAVEAILPQHRGPRDIGVAHNGESCAVKCTAAVYTFHSHQTTPVCCALIEVAFLGWFRGCSILALVVMHPIRIDRQDTPIVEMRRSGGLAVDLFSPFLTTFLLVFLPTVRSPPSMLAYLRAHGAIDPLRQGAGGMNIISILLRTTHPCFPGVLGK